MRVTNVDFSPRHVLIEVDDECTLSYSQIGWNFHRALLGDGGAPMRVPDKYSPIILFYELTGSIEIGQEFA